MSRHAAASALADIVARIDAEHLDAYGVHVLIGDDEAEHRWRSDDRENLYSVSKGVCAIAAGIAVDEGVLSPDSTVGELFGSFELGDGAGQITLRQLLTMTSGIDFAWFTDGPAPWPDLAQEMLPAGSGLELRTSRMHSEWIATGDEAPYAEYAIAGWAGPQGAWRLDGRYGQFVILDSAADAVVTITAHEEDRDHRLAEISVSALSLRGSPARA